MTSSAAPAWLQVRHGATDGRPGRLEHHIFGADRPKARRYYRFHKLIGKWNWRKYTERFIAPRALENRQRWNPSSSPTYTQARHSKSWFWRLPKAIADSTTSDEVLEAWILFRHKHPKRAYHYFKVLQRLVEVGGADSTDWRLKFITSRLHSMHRRVLNLPRLAKFYAQLGVYDELEHMTRFLYPMLPKYSPKQLVLTVHAFGIAKVQDKLVFSEVARFLEPRLQEVTPTDLVRAVHAYAATDVCHYTLMSQISAEVQSRVQQACSEEAPPYTCPTFSQLTEMAEAFAKMKYQDFSFMEMCSLQAEQLLERGLPGPTPPALARLCGACAQLKVHDVRLFEVVLAHASEHWYDYPAAAIAEIGASVAPVMPRDAPEVASAYTTMLKAIDADRDALSLRGIDLAARFMAEVDHKGEFMPGFHAGLVRRIIEMRDETRERYDIARVVEIFARRRPEDRELFSTLCRHLHRHLPVFEPVDFVRFSRGLAATDYRDDRVVHALGKWARKRVSEFSHYDWESFLGSLANLREDGGQLKAELERHRAADPVSASKRFAAPLLPTGSGQGSASVGAAA